MIKEEKNIDFYTTGRQPSEEDFARISEWIKRKKQIKSKQETSKKTTAPKQKSVVSS